jgi:dihydroorotase
MPPSFEVIALRRPDDWHVHLRDGDMLRTVVQYTARQFARAIVMPNLVPPVTNLPAARAYRQRILAAYRSHPAPSLPSSIDGYGLFRKASSCSQKSDAGKV